MWALRVEQLKEKEAAVTYEIEKRIATTISEYEVVISTDYDRFITLVSMNIKNGWVPFGNYHYVKTGNGEFHQPMVKY